MKPITNIVEVVITISPHTKWYTVYAFDMWMNFKSEADWIKWIDNVRKNK
jgi:hypothetical protein